MKITYAPKFASQLKRAPKHIKERVLEFVEELSDNPLPENWDIAKIKGEENVYRVRIGGWRLIYVVEKDEIKLIRIGPRGRVY